MSISFFWHLFCFCNRSLIAPAAIFPVAMMTGVKSSVVLSLWFIALLLMLVGIGVLSLSLLLISILLLSVSNNLPCLSSSSLQGTSPPSLPLFLVTPMMPALGLTASLLLGPNGTLSSTILLACRRGFNARSMFHACAVVLAVVEFSTVTLCSLSALYALYVCCLPCPFEIAEVSCICCLILSLVTLPSTLWYTRCSPPLPICTLYALCSPPPILHTPGSHTCQRAVRGSIFGCFPGDPSSRCLTWATPGTSMATTSSANLLGTLSCGMCFCLNAQLQKIQRPRIYIQHMVGRTFTT